MIYKMKIADSVDEMVFDLLEVPIEDKDIEGTADNTTIDGNVFTDYLWLKKQFTQKWSLMCKDDYTQLRGFYTRQWENAEVPTYKLYVGNDIRETKSASGNPLQITNSTEYDAPILGFKLNGNTEQTTYTGKNLVNQNLIGNSTWHGLTTTASPESVRFSGTTDNNYPSWIFYADGYMLKDNWYPTVSSVYTPRGQFCDNTPHRLTIRVSGNTVRYQTIAFFVGFMDGTFSGNQFVPEGQNVATYSTSKAVNFIAVGFKGGNVSFDNTLQIQFEAGSTSTDFEPYVGGIASPNPDYPQAVNVVTGEQVVEICGKNLFSKSYDNFGLNANTGEIMSISGRYSWFGRVKEGETYTISRSEVGGSSYYWGAFFASAPEVNLQSITHADFGASSLNNTVIAPAGAKYFGIFYGSALSPNAQLELGNQATTYEAYRGTDYEVNLGKNLLENTHAIGSTTTNGMTFTTNSDGTITLDGTASALTWYVFHSASLVLPAGTYTLSTGTTTTTTIGVYNDSFGNTLTGSTNTKTFTSPTSGNVSIRVPSGVHVDNLTIKPQIELGSTATTYAPYFTPIELCKIGTYQDYIWNDNGTWKVHKEIQKELIDTFGTPILELNGIRFSGVEHPTPYQGYPELYCEYFRKASSYADAVNQNNITPNMLALNVSGVIICNIKGATTTSDYTNFFTNNDVIVYYPLATATDTAITESALITQLNAIVQASLPVGLNNVSNISIAPNLAGDMELSYELIHEKETIIRDTTPVRLTLTDGGVINPCECRQNVQITMRETTQ